jgi:arginase family enzyme
MGIAMSSLPWKLYSMEMDPAGKILGRFFERNGYDIERTNPVDAAAELWKHEQDALVKRGNPLAVYCKKETIEEAVKAAIKPKDEKALVVYGSGDYHHYTYGLAKIAERLSKEFTYIHIDHHCDWFGNSTNPDIACGNFVGHIARNTANKGLIQPRNILFIGSRILYYKHIEEPQEKTIGFKEWEMREDNFKAIREVLADNHEDAYLSIDLDVMNPYEARTAHSRGGLKKEEMMYILDMVKSSKRLIGADVLGYCINIREADIKSKWEARFGFLGKFLQRKQTLQLYKSIVDKIIDKKNNGGKLK